MTDNFREWKKFAKGKQVVTLYIGEALIFEEVRNRRTHRDFIAAVLKDKGLQVTRWAHEYGPLGDIKKWGLVYAATDSDLKRQVEVHGIVGENLERISNEYT